MRGKRLINLLVAAVLIGINVVSYFRMAEYSTMDDGFVEFGWPFSVYCSGGYASVSVIVWTGVVGNVFVGLALVRLIQWGMLKRRGLPKQ